MSTISTSNAATRHVYCVLSSKSLPYSRHALRSLLEKSLEPLHLRLITDNSADKDALEHAISNINAVKAHTIEIFTKSDLDVLAEEQFALHPNIRKFRNGHPCWRKITDPILLSTDDAEIIILDPDLYFPNSFKFETTPKEGLLLMWQQPNCLLPHEIVVRALESGVALAHHVDIGVAQLRRNSIQMDWLDSLIATLSGNEELPNQMHIEAIVWAALAMRFKGGYLDSSAWKCWRNSQWKRLARLIGVSGRHLLSTEPWTSIKCFHGGGAAKWWIDSFLSHKKSVVSSTISHDTPITPFVELQPRYYFGMNRIKKFAASIGYYKWFRSNSI